MMTTDPEHQRLKDRVVETGLALAEARNNPPGTPHGVDIQRLAQDDFDDACQAVRDYLSSPATQELLPCPFCGHADMLYEVSSGGWNGVTHCDYCGAIGPYPQIGDTKPSWNTRAPCIPPSQDTEVEKSRSVGALSDEDAAKIGRSLMATIDANREHPLLKDWTPAEDPAEIVGDLLWAFDTPRFPDNTAEQVYPSDAEIYDEWVEFARAILSKSRHSISPETLHKLWSLAQTEAQEQFMIDPRGILSGAGKA
jgi:hypothetical protein